jgi:hypothetical protein
MITDLEMMLYVAGEAVSPPGHRYPVNLREGSTCAVQVFDRVQPWGWRVELGDFTPLNDREGWCGIKAAVYGIDGSLYGPPRPFLFYAKRWIYPSLLVWPDSWAGPVVLAISVPGLPGRKCMRYWDVNASMVCQLDQDHEGDHDYQLYRMGGSDE